MPMPSKPDNLTTSVTIRRSTRTEFIAVTHDLVPVGQVMTMDERLQALIIAYRKAVGK